MSIHSEIPSEPDSSNRPADQFRSDPVFAVSTLSSLFSVCAFALEATSDWRDDIRDRADENIKWTLFLGALLADDVACMIDQGGEQ